MAQDERRAKKLAEKTLAAYASRFPDLRDKIIEFPGFNPLQPRNYNAEGQNAKKLADHFKNTEFDIVLETSEHLFIGEAKDESSFGTDGKLVLVHQLIRQYVIAQILMDLVAETDKRPLKSIVPFVIAPRGKKLDSLERTAQIRFMTHYPKEEEPCLKKSNILSWKELTSLP